MSELKLLVFFVGRMRRMVDDGDMNRRAFDEIISTLYAIYQ